METPQVAPAEPSPSGGADRLPQELLLPQFTSVSPLLDCEPRGQGSPWPGKPSRQPPACAWCQPRKWPGSCWAWLRLGSAARGSRCRHLTQTPLSQTPRTDQSQRGGGGGHIRLEFCPGMMRGVFVVRPARRRPWLCRPGEPGAESWESPELSPPTPGHTDTRTYRHGRRCWAVGGGRRRGCAGAVGAALSWVRPGVLPGPHAQA